MNIEMKKAMEMLRTSLSQDKSEGSYYYSWQANIAMAFFDQFINDHEGVVTVRQLQKVANKAAKRFLDQLVHESNKEDH